MENLAEKSLSGHVEHDQLEGHIAIILEHHQVPSGPLGGFDQLQALLDRPGRRDFAGDVLAMVHGVDRHVGVHIPGSRDPDQVEVLALAEFFPLILRAGVKFRVVRCARESFFRRLGFFRPQVAKGLDLDPLDTDQRPHVARPSLAQPDDADAYDFDRFGGVTGHVESLFTVPCGRKTG